LTHKIQSRNPKKFEVVIMKNKIFNPKLAIILIVFLTGLIYANSLKNSFVRDDYLVIVNNSFIKSWGNLPTIFSKSYLTPYVKIGCCFFPDSGIGSGETSYRPIVTLSYFIDYSIWKLNPFGYHFNNLILHILNAILLFMFIDLTIRNKKIALLASLFFALHPVNSEAVNVVSFREDLLVLMFFLSALILYIKLDNLSGIKKSCFYILSLVSFLLALFSKEMAITLPALLILYDYYFVFHGKAKELFSRFKTRYIGYIVVLLFYILVRFAVMVNTSEPAAEYPGGSFYTNILTIPRVFAAYIKWFLFPVAIHATLPGNSSLISYSFFDPRVLLSVALIITCIIAAIKIRKASKEISFSIFWVFVTLLPVSNIWPLSDYMAGRYLYIPSAGFCFLVAVLLFRLNTLKVFAVSPNFLKRFAKGTVVILIIFYSIFTIIRNRVWRNDTSLWLELVKNYPNNGLAHSNLGGSFKKSGLIDKAIAEYKIAITLNPQLAGAYNQLGVIFGEKERYSESITYFKKSIKVDPNYLQAYDNLAVTYARIKKWEAARKTWEKALEINPQYEAAKDNLKELRGMGR